PTSGWRALRSVVVTVFVAFTLLFSVPLTLRLLSDGSNMPLCNKILMLQIQNWLDMHKDSSDLPNSEGTSARSLRQLNLSDQQKEIEEWTTRYQYIPGLQRTDPGDLVVAYLKTPTRWKHHAAGAPWIFAEQKWILLPLD